MEDAIFSQDRLIVRRIHNNRTSLVGMKSRCGEVFDSKRDSIHTKPGIFKDFRERSTSAKFDRNDVLLFRLNKGRHTYIKRCIGLPGDTLLISNSVVFINGHPISFSGILKYKYCAITRSRDSLINVLRERDIEFDNRSYLQKANRVYIIENRDEIEYLYESVFLDSLFPVYRSNEIPIESVFHGINSWDLDNLGPIIIPYKGMDLNVDENSIKQYRHLLEYNEGLSKKELKILVTGELQYTIRQDYLFLLGDNRNFSEDSRHFGFLPECQIIGRTNRILFSWYNNEFQWERLLKRIE